MKDSAVRIKALLLDWDGTLIDSLPLKIQNAGRLFAEDYGVEAAAVEAAYRRHSGIPRRALFDQIARDCMGRPLDEADFPGLSRRFSEGNVALVRESGSLRPGTLEALAALRSAGCLLFVSTSAMQDEMEPLALHFGVADFCTELLGSRPGFSKGPEHAAHVQTTYALTPAQVASVGDDVNDIVLAQKAGIACFGITGTVDRATLEAAGAARVVDTLGEVVAYV